VLKEEIILLSPPSSLALEDNDRVLRNMPGNIKIGR